MEVEFELEKHKWEQELEQQLLQIIGQVRSKKNIKDGYGLKKFMVYIL